MQPTLSVSSQVLRSDHGKSFDIFNAVDCAALFCLEQIDLIFHVTGIVVDW